MIVTIQFIGQRLILFGYIPEMPVQEQIAWKTDVLKVRDGREQRQSLTTVPRQRITYKYSPDNEVDKARLRNQLLGLQAFLLGVPEWWDVRPVTVAMTAGQTLVQCNPANANFFDTGPVMLKLPDGTNIDAVIATVEVNGLELDEGVPQDIPLGSVVVPLRFCYVNESPSLSDDYVALIETEIEFETTQNRDIAFSEMELDSSIFTRHPIDDLVVLVDENMIGGRHGGSMSFDVFPNDADIGVRVQYPAETIGQIGRPKTAWANTLEEIWEWRRLLHYLRGSWRTFYLPTFRNDLPVSATYNLNSDTMLVKDVGTLYASMGELAPFTDIYIQLIDGRTFIKRISGVTDNANGTMTLTLDSAPQVGSEVIQAANIKVSWLVLSRIVGDVVTINHLRPGEAIFRFNTLSVHQ